MLLAAIVGAAGAWALLPWFQDRQLIAELGSESMPVRDRAIFHAAKRAQRRPAFLRRLAAVLDSQDDVRFAAAAEALKRIGQFPPPGRPGEHRDRYWRISLAGAGGKPDSAGLRAMLVHEFVHSGRDNSHVRKALALATQDDQVQVREAAALLAAGLGDDHTLERLLADDDAPVRSSAALDAALAGREQLIEPIKRILAEAADDNEKACAAYALARLAARSHRTQIAAAITQAWNEGKTHLLEKLLHVATLPGTYNRAAVELSEIKEGSVPSAVLYVLRSAKSARKPVRGMAMLAAGKMKLAGAREHVLTAIGDMLAADKAKLTTADAQRLSAAVGVAHKLKLPPGVLAKVIEELWHPGTTLAMVLAAETLGELHSPTSALRRGHAPAERMTTEQLQQLLIRAAQTDPPSLPSAAAAVAAFRHDPDKAAEHLHAACQAEAYLVGDYVAWNLRHVEDKVRVRRLAESFLSPGEHNDNVRATGALMLAMLARGGEWKGQAERIILNRLRGGPQRPERDPYLAGSYKCALLILGLNEFAPDVIHLVQRSDFPAGRALTALILAGKSEGLDMILGRPSVGPEEIAELLTGWMLARVLSEEIPELPTYYLTAPAGVRYWQCRIMRDYYLIHRRAILDRMKP